MLALVITAAVFVYLLITAIEGRIFYSHYQWQIISLYKGRGEYKETYYSDRGERTFASLAFGLLWPISWVVVIVLWNNLTSREREIKQENEIKEQKKRILELEKELNIYG